MIINKTEILSRLKEAYSLKSDLELAKFLKVAPNTISTWKSRSRIDFEILIEKCDYLNWNYLLYGIGNPFLSLTEMTGKTAEPVSGTQESEIENIRKVTRQNAELMTELSREVKQLRDELDKMERKQTTESLQNDGKPLE